MIFPTSRDPKAWADIILHAMKVIASNGEEVRIQQIMDHLATDPNFPGTWDYLGSSTINGKTIEKARTYFYSGIARLNKKKLITSPKKGLYSLIQPEPNQPEPTQSEPTQPEPNQPEPTQPEPNQPVLHVYTRNTYLRQQAIQHTSCFGYHKQKDPECSVCPLDTFCKAAKVSVLKHIALTLNTSKVETLTPVQSPTTPTPRLPSATPTPRRPAATPIPFAAECSVCKQNIPAGGLYVHVENVGAAHEHCAP